MDDWMLVNVEGHVEKIALQVAERMLPREMSRLHSDRLDQIRQALATHAGKNQLSEPNATEIENYPTDELWRPLARAYVDALTHPAAEAVPDLNDESTEQEIRGKTELFWRCLIALHSMPLRQLEALLPNRKDLEPYFAPEDATDTDKHFQRAHTILPFFSMTCKTKEQLLLESQRRAAREQAKKEREKAQEDEAAAAADPTRAADASKPNAARESKHQSSSKAASAHVYGAANTKKWDTFDIDGALDAVDLEEQQAPTKPKRAAVTDDQDPTEAELDAQLKAKLADPAIRDKLRAVLGNTSTGQNDLFGLGTNDIDLDAIIQHGEEAIYNGPVIEEVFE